MNIHSPVQLFNVCALLSDGDERWGEGCWTYFVDDTTVCKSEFSSEWEPVGRDSCWGGLTKQVKCKKTCKFETLSRSMIDFNIRTSFDVTDPECVSTVCYSAFKSHGELCGDEYKKGDYPVTCGGFTDCSPGFYRARCCPNKFA